MSREPRDIIGEAYTLVFLDGGYSIRIERKSDTSMAVYGQTIPSTNLYQDGPNCLMACAREIERRIAAEYDNLEDRR